MRRKLSWEILLLLILILVQISLQAKKQKSLVISGIADLKEFKKLLRTKTNVLVLYLNAPKSAQAVLDAFRDTADVMKGQATLVMIDCSNSETKKLCKKQKVPLDKPYYIKHYKDGDFNKDYDRSETVSSMSNFLRDPTGDLPWQEDPTATDIFHLNDVESLNKFLKKGASAYKKSMIMFYAPWCGFCKTMKPEYVQAAADLKVREDLEQYNKGEAYLAAIDVAKSGNAIIRQAYNITGFPTLYYFENGQFRFPYDGDNTRQAIVEFLRDPTSRVQQKKKNEDDGWSTDTDVLHLTGENFDKSLAQTDHALIVFYAPWCGHCKKIKPEFEKAATRVKTEKLNGILAAVDVTKEPELAQRFGVKGYPTLKYFNKGEYKFDAFHTRHEDQMVEFIKEPKAPPPTPPAELPWAEQESAVRHLDASTFRNALRKVKHALVMFYAPWCGHCKSMKPEFVNAAEAFVDELMVAFGAVDCTQHRDLCTTYDVRGFPTIKYFSFYDKLVQDYKGGRKVADFVQFIHMQMQAMQAKVKTASEAGFGVNVVISNDDNFNELVASSTPTLVMFYATFCAPCSEMKPVYSRVATSMKEAGGKVQVIAIEAPENPKTADSAAIDIIPAFKMYMSGKIIENFEADRSFDNLVDFCKKHQKVKDEL